MYLLPVSLLILLTSETVRVSADLCDSIEKFPAVYENLTIGAYIQRWPQPDENFKYDIDASSDYDMCRLYVNFTEIGMQVLKDIDLENGDFPKVDGASVGKIKCNGACHDSNAATPPGGLMTEIKVLVMAINQHPPQFRNSSYSFSVKELTPVGTTVYKFDRNQVHDPDFGDDVARFSLQSDGDDTFFLLNNQNAYIGLQKEVDYEIGPKLYNLTLIAYDSSGSPDNELSGSTQLIIDISDIDDQPPKFEENMYELHIKEQDASIVNVFRDTTPPLHAYDQDYGINDTVFYRLVADATLQSNFSIDKASGQIKILQTLDREELEDRGIQLVLTLQAYEDTFRARSTTTSVRVVVEDIDDHLPVFNPTTDRTELLEHSADGSVVMFVTATDRDLGRNAEFQYEMIDGTAYFRVENFTGGLGLIRVNNATAIDREIQDTIHFTVGTNTDFNRSSQATVTVILLDINDKRPQFSKDRYEFEIKNNTADGSDPVADPSPLVTGIEVVGAVLGQVHATDADVGDNGRVVYYLGSPGIDKYLTVNISTGEITVIRTPLPLEGAIASLTFFVMARDGGYPPQQAVASVKVVKYKDDISAYLYVDAPSVTLEKDKDILQRNVSSILAVDAEIVDIVPDSTGGVDLTRSRLQLRARYHNGGQLSRVELQSLLEEHHVEIYALFDAYKASREPEDTVSVVDSFGDAQIALILIACVIFVGAVLSIVAHCYLLKRAKKGKRLHLSMLGTKSTLYESQELKIDVMAETSDYDKSESLDSDDMVPEGGELEEATTTWNPLFTAQAGQEELAEPNRHCYPYPAQSDNAEFVPRLAESQIQENWHYRADILSNELQSTEASRKEVLVPSHEESGEVDLQGKDTEHLTWDSVPSDSRDTLPRPDYENIERGSGQEEPNEPDRVLSDSLESARTGEFKSLIAVVSETDPSSVDDNVKNDPFPDYLNHPDVQSAQNENLPVPDYSSLQQGNSANTITVCTPLKASPGVLPISDDKVENKENPKTESVPEEPKPDYAKVSFSNVTIAIHEDDIIEVIDNDTDMLDIESSTGSPNEPTDITSKTDFPDEAPLLTRDSTYEIIESVDETGDSMDIESKNNLADRDSFLTPYDGGFLNRSLNLDETSDKDPILPNKEYKPSHFAMASTHL